MRRPDTTRDLEAPAALKAAGLLLFGLFAAAPAAIAASAQETVVMKSGARLEVVSAEQVEGQWKLVLPSGGEISIPEAAVRRVESESTGAAPAAPLLAASGRGSPDGLPRRVPAREHRPEPIELSAPRDIRAEATVRERQSAGWAGTRAPATVGHVVPGPSRDRRATATQPDERQRESLRRAREEQLYTPRRGEVEDMLSRIGSRNGGRQLRRPR